MLAFYVNYYELLLIENYELSQSTYILVTKLYNLASIPNSWLSNRYVLGAHIIQGDSSHAAILS